MEQRERIASLELEIERLTVLCHDLIFRLVCSDRLVPSSQAASSGDKKGNSVPAEVEELYRTLKAISGDRNCDIDVDKSRTHFFTRDQLERENEALVASLKRALKQKEEMEKELFSDKRNVGISKPEAAARPEQLGPSGQHARKETAEHLSVTRTTTTAENGHASEDRLKEPASTKASPPANAKDVVIIFSGFEEVDQTFNNKFRKRLKKAVSSLGGKVIRDIFSGTEKAISSYTHCVAPKQARTLETVVSHLIGSLVVTPDWIVESLSKGEWVSEKEFLVDSSGANIMKDASFHLDSSFQNSGSGVVERAEFLICKVGQGAIVDSSSPSEADYVLIGSDFPVSDVTEHHLTWNELLEKIQSTRKRKRAIELTGEDLVLADAPKTKKRNAKRPTRKRKKIH